MNSNRPSLNHERADLEVAPTVAALQQRAEEIRRQELDKTLRRLKDLSPEDAQRLDALTQAIIKKLLQRPIANLKARRSPSHLQRARELFALDEPPSP